MLFPLDSSLSYQRLVPVSPFWPAPHSSGRGCDRPLLFHIPCLSWATTPALVLGFCTPLWTIEHTLHLRHRPARRDKCRCLSYRHRSLLPSVSLVADVYCCVDCSTNPYDFHPLPRFARQVGYLMKRIVMHLMGVSDLGICSCIAQCLSGPCMFGAHSETGNQAPVQNSPSAGVYGESGHPPSLLHPEEWDPCLLNSFMHNSGTPIGESETSDQADRIMGWGAQLLSRLPIHPARVCMIIDLCTRLVACGLSSIRTVANLWFLAKFVG